MHCELKGKGVRRVSNHNPDSRGSGSLGTHTGCNNCRVSRDGCPNGVGPRRKMGVGRVETGQNSRQHKTRDWGVFRSFGYIVHEGYLDVDPFGSHLVDRIEVVVEGDVDEGCTDEGNVHGRQQGDQPEVHDLLHDDCHPHD